MSIDHVVVLMLENRSFDHMLGDLPGVDGASRANYNLEDPGSAIKYNQLSGASYSLKSDPKHELANVQGQIYHSGLGAMGGFVNDFVHSYPHTTGSDRQQIMDYFEEGRLPALHALAKSFHVCDRWFSSVPGPTWANRFFVHSGTSLGWVSMPGSAGLGLHLHRYNQGTVYDRLNAAGVSWRIYAGDIPQSLCLIHQWEPKNLRCYRRFRQFEGDVNGSSTKDFPSYVFIEPSYLSPSQNDQHPPSDLLRGDDLIASVYNALRSNDELWDSTLLIVVWDEHGGLYDHVYPEKATPPDGNTQDGCNFDQYGVRVPAILVSKWIQPGVFSKTLDHTSILRYLSDKYLLAALTKRVKDASTFATVINTTRPNLAAPASINRIPSAQLQSLNANATETLNKNQIALIALSRLFEALSAVDNATIASRALRATVGSQSEAEVAVERTWAFINQQR